MKNYKLQNYRFFYIFLATFVLIFANSCSPTVKFSDDENIAKNRYNSNQNSQKTTGKKQKPKTFYDKPATLILPNSPINRHSNKIISIAERWLGVSYLYGGNTQKGVDCSGFVKNVYSEIGVNLPRTSAQQFAFAIPVKTPTVGDLVFFKKNNRINHVGIYIGNDKIIHSAINKGVVIQSIKNNSLEKMFAGFGRIKTNN